MCLLWEHREEGEGEDRGCKSGFEVTQGGCAMGQAMQSYNKYTVKKVSGFPVPGRDVTYQTLPGWK